MNLYQVTMEDTTMWYIIAANEEQAATLAEGESDVGAMMPPAVLQENVEIISVGNTEMMMNGEGGPQPVVRLESV